MPDNTQYICFLPFRGEFGWYLMTFVKRFHGFIHPHKIVCTKRGHECLFPTAEGFFYDWNDIADGYKAGVVAISDEEEEMIKGRVRSSFPDKNIEFISSSELGWHNKHNFAHHSFIPQNKYHLGLKVDVVITPRNRTIDPHRNWGCHNWQALVDGLVAQNITVGVCGSSDTSCYLENVLHRSYEHIDVDSDVEMINNAKVVITQESGLQYLSFLCQRPTFCIDYYHQEFGVDAHRNLAIAFKNPTYTWDDPKLLVNEVIFFLRKA